jgi:hypothetical protein
VVTECLKYRLITNEICGIGHDVEILFKDNDVLLKRLKKPKRRKRRKGDLILEGVDVFYTEHVCLIPAVKNGINDLQVEHTFFDFCYASLSNLKLNVYFFY